MPRTRAFDEVMIVNPSVPGQGVTHMRFHYAPQFGYYADPYGYGYYAEPPEYGYAGWGEVPEYGYFAENAPYGEPVEYAGWAEAPEVAGWGAYGYAEAEPGYQEADPGYSEEEPVGYFAEEDRAYAEQPYEGWGQTDGYGAPVYAEVPEMIGWGENEPLADEYSGYDASELEGYVRDTPSPFNAGCPLPSNVSGLEDADPFGGYIKPETVNAACGSIVDQPGPTPSVPETFKPLW
jgi:hypothetical protein